MLGLLGRLSSLAGRKRPGLVRTAMWVRFAAIFVAVAPARCWSSRNSSSPWRPPMPHLRHGRPRQQTWGPCSYWPVVDLLAHLLQSHENGCVEPPLR